MNVGFWKGTLAAFVVAVLIKAIVQLWWLPANVNAVFSRAPPYTNAADQLIRGVAVAALFTFIGVYVLSEFLEKLARAQNKKPLKHGAQFGLAFGLAESIWLFILPVTFNYRVEYVVLNLLANIVAFAAAAWVYQCLDPGPVVRGEENKRYLQNRKRL